jgi:hypothetical protein
MVEERNWSDLSNIDRTDFVCNLFLHELEIFHFSGEDDKFINVIFKSCIDSLSDSTKQHIGSHLNLLISAYANDCSDHTLNPEVSQPIPNYLLILRNFKVKLSLAEQGYLRHMIHALCNNVVLLLMIGSSMLHGIIPGIQPFWCVDRLIQMFVNMRIHTTQDVLLDRYTNMIKNMQQSRDTNKENDDRRDLSYSLFQSIIKEKDILEQLLPGNIPEDEMIIALKRIRKKYNQN